MLALKVQSIIVEDASRESGRKTLETNVLKTLGGPPKPVELDFYQDPSGRVSIQSP